MQTRKTAVLVLLAAAQLLVLLPLALLDPMKFADVGWFQRSHAIGLLLGCGFAQASVAAAWVALGPLSLRVRGPASAALVLLAATLLAINIAVNSPGPSSEALLLGASFVGVWLCVQVPLWIARALYGVHVADWSEANPFRVAGEHQFGIRQLFIVTAAAAAALGFGRLMLSIDADRAYSLGGPLVQMLAIVGLFIVCNSAIAFTIITAPLLPRHWLFAMALGGCAAAAMTLVEWDMFSSLATGPDRREGLVIVTAMNGLQFTWLLINLLAMRIAGYRLVSVRGIFSRR